ncbi:MAG TPA: TlpA disulfide reductase family protein, partial [Pyrinomonadaceae bacterium]|nr:TlpA disulfide reductase family protein [Pyrinomonadaceae bacterium]
MNFKILNLALIFLFSGFISPERQAFAASAVGDNEFTGQFETVLAANVENFEKVVFKYVSDESVKNNGSSQNIFKKDTHLTLGRLYDPQTGKTNIPALLVEEPESDEEEDGDAKKPVIFVDLDASGNFSDNEKFTFEQAKKDNPYLWNVTVNLPVKNNFFTACPLFLQYFKRVRMEKMSAQDRLLTQTTEVLARGRVEVKGKKILAQYAYSFEDKKITPQKGWLGVDGNEDGAVDMDELSWEAAKADDETVVFRVGETYVSTKKVDLGKNQIVMREHAAKDYKRLELAVGKEFPDFPFTDFAGKKRRFAEFRGKYILLDVWGFWCPPCRTEIPFLREAARRFK